MNFKKLVLALSVFSFFGSTILEAGCSNGSCSIIRRKKKNTAARRTRAVAVVAKVATAPARILTKTLKKSVKVAAKRAKNTRRRRVCTSGRCSF